MEWMRVRDSSSSLRISNLGRNGYRGSGSLSLSLSRSLFSLGGNRERRKRWGAGKKKEKRKGREENDMRGPCVSGNFANKTLPLFNID